MKRRMFMGGVMAAISFLFGMRTRAGDVPSVAGALQGDTGFGTGIENTDSVVLLPGWIELRVYRVRKIGGKLVTVVESGQFPQAAVDAYPRLLTEDEYRQAWFNWLESAEPLPFDPSKWDSLPCFLASNGYTDGCRDFREWMDEYSPE